MLSWCQDMGPGTGLLLILIGAVYLLYGWSLFKVLITLNAAVLGGYIGTLLGGHLGSGVMGGILGAIVSAAITYPLLKWGVAVMGGICGAMVGAGIWRASGLDPHYAWAGAMTGLVGFGLFSFILFRGSIIMYTSVQGAVMIVIGLLGVAFKYHDMAPKIAQSMSNQPLILPIGLIVPTILGLVYQQIYSNPVDAGGDKKN